MRRKVLVIGSGLAGTLIANNLVRKHDVTVLEAGKSDGYEYPHVEYLKKEFGHVMKTFCHGEGGTTNLWHNGLIPMRPEDVENVQFGEILREAAAFSDRAAESLFFPSPHFSSEYRGLLKKMGELNDRLGLFVDGVDCLLHPKSYKGLRIGSGARTHFRVTDIEFTARGGSIERVDFTAGSERHSTSTDTVVISGGSLGTPSLVSKVLSALGYSASNAGMGLIDHPMGFVGKVSKSSQRCSSGVPRSVIVGLRLLLLSYCRPVEVLQPPGRNLRPTCSDDGEQPGPVQIQEPPWSQPRGETDPGGPSS